MTQLRDLKRRYVGLHVPLPTKPVIEPEIVPKPRLKSGKSGWKGDTKQQEEAAELREKRRQELLEESTYLRLRMRRYEG